MSMDIFKEVPESFHLQFINTLENLEDENVYKQEIAWKNSRNRVSGKKLAILIAAAVLALSTLTVGAASVFKWHERAKERFGVTEETENSLTGRELAAPEYEVIQEEGITFSLIHSVRTEKSFYYLMEVTVPDSITLNDYVVFEESSVTSDKEFKYCVANFVSDSIEGNKVYCEVELYAEPGVDYKGEKVVIHLSDLIQTSKTEKDELLLEGEWDIPVTLAGLPDMATFWAKQQVRMGNHDFVIEKVEAGSFLLRLYMNEEQAFHGLQYYPVTVTGVRYQDGKEISQLTTPFDKTHHKDEVTGETYFEVTLEQAIDPRRISEIVLNEGEAVIYLYSMRETIGENPEEFVFYGEDGIWELLGELKPDVDLENWKLLYFRYDNAVMTDGKAVYLLDVHCGKIETIIDLTLIGFDRGRSGDIVAGPGGSSIYIMPYTGSDKGYICQLNLEERVLQEVPAEQMINSDVWKNR